MPAGGWDSAPGCVQQHVPGSEGVYKPYEKCADFFTFGHGSKINTFADGVNSSYWVLVILGIVVMVLALIGWVWLEDKKLRAQAAHLLEHGIGARGPAAGVGP